MKSRPSQSACKRFTVQGLPYKRTLDELGESVFVKCLAPGQLMALARWTETAAVGEQLEQGWYNEDAEHYTVVVQRVA